MSGRLECFILTGQGSRCLVTVEMVPGVCGDFVVDAGGEWTWSCDS